MSPEFNMVGDGEMISVMKMIDYHMFLGLRGALRDEPKEGLGGRLTKLT